MKIKFTKEIENLKNPFINLKNTEFSKNNKNITFCIDAFLFIQRLDYFKNIISSYNKIDNCFNIKIYKEKPEYSYDLTNNRIIKNDNCINIKLNLMKKEKLEDENIKVNQDIKMFISDLHQYIVFPEQIDILLNENLDDYSKNIYDTYSKKTYCDLNNQTFYLNSEIIKSEKIKMYLEYLNIYNKIITETEYPEYIINYYDKEKTEYEKIIEIKFPEIKELIWIK